MGYNGFTKYTILKTNIPKKNDNYFISTKVLVYTSKNNRVCV